MTDTFDRSGRHGGSRQESPPRPPRASTRPAHDKTDPRPGRPGAGRACLRRARVSTQSVTIARAVRQRHTHSCMRAPCRHAAAVGAIHQVSARQNASSAGATEGTRGSDVDGWVEQLRFASAGQASQRLPRPHQLIHAPLLLQMHLQSPTHADELRCRRTRARNPPESGCHPG